MRGFRLTPESSVSGYRCFLLSEKVLSMGNGVLTLLLLLLGEQASGSWSTMNCLTFKHEKNSISYLMKARSSRKNKFKEAAIFRHSCAFKAGPIKTTDSHVFSHSRVLFYDYLDRIKSDFIYYMFFLIFWSLGVFW